MPGSRTQYFFLIVISLFAVFSGSSNAAEALGSKNLSRQQSAEVFNDNENYALIVGVDQYDDIGNLNYAVADAKALSQFFKGQGYRVQLLTNHSARRKLILKKLRAIAELAGDGSDDTGNVVFAFSGHGFRADDNNYLATVQTELDDIRNTGLALNEVKQILSNAKVRQRVLLIDACRDDPERPTKGAQSKRGSFVADRDAEGLAVLYSTGANRRSWEDGKLGQGVFTHYLLQGLRGGAADDTGLVTFDGLHRFVRSRVKHHVYDRFDAVQVPYIGGERTGEFVLAQSALKENAYVMPEARLDVLAEPISATKLDAAAESKPKAAEVGKLWVDTEPAGARVMIMNIKPKYKGGIELARGQKYDVLVRHPGYQSLRQWVSLDKPERRLNVTLEKFRRLSFEPEMVDIPAGSFAMGDLDGDGERDELPVHRVQLKAFQMAKTEVTFEQYDAYVKATGARSLADRGRGRGNRPVINVRWEEAQRYINWLNQKTGKRYRLPSEAEWEYAARAGSSTKYSWGDGIGRNNANCGGCGSRWDGEQSAPVASFSANRWGLFDMHGNVNEWVQDTWHASYRSAPSGGEAWSSGGGNHVLRGGSWIDNPLNLRSANRGVYSVGMRLSNVGFRLARTP